MLLIPFYVECVCMILVVVPPVTSHKILVCVKQASLAGRVVEVKLFEIVNKIVFAIVSYFLDSPTSVHH